MHGKVSRFGWLWLAALIGWSAPAVGASGETDPAVVVAALDAAFLDHRAKGQSASDSDRDAVCAELRGGIGTLAGLARQAEARGQLLSLQPLSRDLVLFVATECQAPPDCSSGLDAIAFDLKYLVEIGLAEPDDANGEAIDRWSVAVARLCFDFEVVFATRTGGEHVDWASCRQPVALDVAGRIRITPLSIEKIDGHLYLTGTGSASHAIETYTHSLTCEAGDSISPVSAVSAAPLKVRLRLDPFNVDPDSYAVSRTFVVDINPGTIDMTWNVCADGCLVVTDPWWSAMWAAHYKDRAVGDGYYRFRVPSGVSGREVATGTFSGAGSYDVYGVWTGADQTDIAVIRAE
jgi:hypothetical protein